MLSFYFRLFFSISFLFFSFDVISQTRDDLRKRLELVFNTPDGLICKRCDIGKCIICDGSKKCTSCNGRKSEQFHQEECPNCKTWNDSYRNAVGCHRCKNNKTIRVPGCSECNKSGLCSLCKGTGNCTSCKGKGWYLPEKGKNLTNLKLLPTANECELEVLLIQQIASGVEMLKKVSINQYYTDNYKYDKSDYKVYDFKKDLVAMGLEDGERFYDVKNKSFSNDPIEYLSGQNGSYEKNVIFSIIENLKDFKTFMNFPRDNSLSWRRNYEFIDAIKYKLSHNYYEISEVKGIFLSNNQKNKECNVLAKTLMSNKILIEKFKKDIIKQLD